MFLDLGEILSDSISDKKMTRITWIIIFLIVISICVTCLEVLLRFAILHGKGKAVDVTSMKKSAVAGPTLLLGRSVIWMGKVVRRQFAG